MKRRRVGDVGGGDDFCGDGDIGDVRVGSAEGEVVAWSRFAAARSGALADWVSNTGGADGAFSTLVPAAALRTLTRVAEGGAEEGGPLEGCSLEELYVMGGHDGQNPISSVERYDPAKNAWEAVAPMSTARAAPAAAVVDGKLYVMGGQDGGIRLLSSVEQYDPAKNEWVAMASMALNTKTNSLCAVSM